jgi:preprotein translocase subunit SecA
MMSDYCDIITEKSKGVGFEQFNERVIRSISIAPNFDKDSFEKMSSEQISDHLYENLKKEYNRRSELLVKQAWPVIKNIYERQANVYENIAVPIIEGNKVLQVIVNLKKTYETEGREIAKGVSKTITLLMIDEYWKEHLREMDELKQSVQNAAYEQKDPLLVYKFESFNLFEGVLEKISKEVISYVMRAKLPIREDNDQTALSEGRRRRADLSNTTTSRSDLATNGGEPRSNAPVRVEKKVGRNDPCPCGSGKKYKNCHGRDAE